MKTFEEVEAELRQMAQLPEGYKIEGAGDGDVLIIGPRLCFCITGASIESGRYRAEFVPALEGLIEAHTLPPSGSGLAQ